MWWLVVVGGLLIVLLPALFEVQIFLVAWFSLALLLSIVPVVWGFYHRQAIWEAVPQARNWAAGISLLNTLVVYSTMQQTGGWPALELITVSLLALAFTILFVILFLLQLVGASIGIMAGTGSPDLGAAARRGTHAWGLGVLFLGFFAGLELGGFRSFLKASIPIVTLILCLLARTPELNPHVMVTRWVRWLERRLILRWDRDSSVLFFDFRGAALGVLAGAMAGLMSASGVFMPLQLQTLGPLIGLRNSNELFRSIGTKDQLTVDPGRIVLVQFDPSTRSQMMADSSEPAIQAAAIRRLQQLDASTIVLPLPLLNLSWLDHRQSTNTATDYEAPEPDAAAIRRARNDLALLAAAMKESGEVIVASHGGVVAGEAQPVLSAAKAVGAAGLGNYRIGSINTIPTLWLDPAPLAYLLANRLQPARWKLPQAGALDTVRSDMLDAHDPVIVNFQSRARGNEFSRTTYSSLLQTNATGIYVIPPQPASGPYPKDRSSWLREPDFFKDKVFLLDSIAWHEQKTPIGNLGMPELQAHAAMTLVNHTYIRKAALPLDLFFTIGFGLLAGHLCLRRDPFRAAWRVGIAVLMLVIGVGLAFVLRLTWVDPVLPLIAAVIAFMLVTQFTFSLEHVALQRNRALLQRFVAPQVVEELLEDPENKLGLGGSRQRICVLFADVRNFTPFAERHTSEEVIETINAYMTALTEALHAYGGLLDKYTGDGLMALFRITQDPPDEQIQEAVLASLAMRDVAKTVSRRLVEQGKQALQVGISMHYGEAVVGLVGNPNQFNYTALGHTVVVAARLNTVAQPGDVLVSDAVYQAIAESFTVEECPEVMVKGLSQPVRPYRVEKAHRISRKTRIASLLSGN